MVFLLCLGAFVVSGDIFFVIHIGDFTLRIFLLLMIPIAIKGLRDLVAGSVWPAGFGYLLIWTFFIIVFVPHTIFLSRNIFYAVWLVFSVFTVLGITAVIDTPEKFHTILLWYVYSFVFSALFGLSQFLLPLVGLKPYLVQQWWFPGILARINGFTYEPSYFATYMITGWVMIDYLRQKRVSIPHLRPAFWTVTAALILCSSRGGWLVMLGWTILRSYWYLREHRLPWRNIAIASGFACCMVLLVSAWAGLETRDLNFLWRGLGIADNSGSYSSMGRWDVAMQTLHLYEDHPIVGVSLGGVAPAIAAQNSITIANNNDAKANEAMCTTLEVLAASGTLGFLFFVLYFSNLIGTMFRGAFNSPVGKALVWGLIALLVILQADQNILRAYLWFHIGLLSAGYRLLKDASEQERGSLISRTGLHLAEG